MDHFPDGVLLATDGSEDARVAARVAADLSARSGCPLHVVHAWQAVPSPRFEGFIRARVREEAEELLEREVARVRSVGGTVAEAHLREGRAAEEIADLAGEVGVDLVVVGSRGLGAVESLLVGSVSEGVARLAPCPVLVVRGGASWPPREVLVGDDSSEEAREAAETAARLAGLYGACARLLQAHHPRAMTGATGTTATPDPKAADPVLDAAEENLRDRAAGLEGILGEEARCKVVVGDAAAAIQQEAEDCGDGTLVAVGSRGLGAVGRLALGSVSTDVLRAVDGPVIVCPSRGGAR